MPNPYAQIRAMHGQDYTAAEARGETPPPREAAPRKRKRTKNQYRKRSRLERMDQTRPNTGSK